MSRAFFTSLALPIVAVALSGVLPTGKASAQTSMTVPFNHSFNVGKHHGSPILGINLNAPITGVFGNGNGVGIGGIGGAGIGKGGHLNGNVVSPYPMSPGGSMPFFGPTPPPPLGYPSPFSVYPSGPHTSVWGNGNGVGIGGRGPGIGIGGHGNGNTIMLPY